MRFSKSAIPWRQSDYGARLKWTRVQTTDSIFDPFTNRIRSFHEFSLKRRKKKIVEISKRSNLIDFDCNSTIISSFFSSSSFLRSELWDQVQRYDSNSSMFSFPHCFEFPLTLICIHSFIQNSFGNGKQILIAFLDKNVEFVRTELRIEKQEKSYFWQFFVINFFVVVYELVYVKKFCSMKCSNLVVQILNCCNTSRFLFRIFSRF